MSMNAIAFSVFLLVHLGVVISGEIHIRGPTGDVFPGDYEKFTCEMEGSDVKPNSGLVWKLKFKSGDVVDVGLNESDSLPALEVKHYSQDKMEMISFLRVPSADVVSVICNYRKISEEFPVTVKDLAAITADNDPCTKSEETGKPVTSIYLPSMDLLSPSYRRSHFIDDQFATFQYGLEATQFKLVCYSTDSNAPRWSMKKETSDKMKFAAWADAEGSKSCQQQVLHIYQVEGEHGAMTNLTFTCTAGKESSTVNMGFTFNPFRQMDFNSTENCINTIVDKFYNNELTGVGIGSGLTIIGMMAGIAVLKKKLSEQEKKNKELESKNQNGNGGNRNSTELLTGNNNP